MVQTRKRYREDPRAVLAEMEWSDDTDFYERTYFRDKQNNLCNPSGPACITRWQSKSNVLERYCNKNDKLENVTLVRNQDGIVLQWSYLDGDPPFVQKFNWEEGPHYWIRYQYQGFPALRHTGLNDEVLAALRIRNERNQPHLKETLDLLSDIFPLEIAITLLENTVPFGEALWHDYYAGVRRGKGAEG